MRKPVFCICENKDADQLRGTAKLVSAFVFTPRIVQFLFFLNPKFLVSSHLLWLCSPVCVGPGLKPRRPVFSQRGSYNNNVKCVCFNCRQFSINSICDPNRYPQHMILWRNIKRHHIFIILILTQNFPHIYHILYVWYKLGTFLYGFVPVIDQ